MKRAISRGREISAHTRVWLALLATLSAAGCGTQFSDPIRRDAVIVDSGPFVDRIPPADSGVIADASTDANDGSTPIADLCTQRLTASECSADTLHGCSFQPNLPGCHAEDAACPPGSCRGGDPFVRRSGQTLGLHDAAFRFVGAVSWGIAGGTAGCRISSYDSTDAALTRTFDDLADMQVAALRIWAFQSYAGPTGTDYANFDRVVSYARRAGVRLMFVLENFRNDCTLAGSRDDSWFSSGYRSPYGNYALSYTDYVRGVVTHFRDEPTILAWELMHEAGADDFNAIDGFVRDMSLLIRTTDPNHLIALGINNGDTPGTSNQGEPSNYRKLHEHSEIDLLDVHDLNTPDAALTASMLRDQSIAAAIGKPIFVGAAAVSLADTSASAFTQRSSKLTNKLEAALASGFAGFLVYDYYPAWPEVGWEFDGRSEEPLAGALGVLALHAPPNR